jgi:hypothetical protein
MADDPFINVLGFNRGNHEKSALKLELQDLLWLDQKQLNRLEHIDERTSQLTHAATDSRAHEIVRILQKGDSKFENITDYPLAQHAVQCISIRSASPELTYVSAVHKVFQSCFKHIPPFHSLIDEAFSEVSTQVLDEMVSSTAFLARYQTLAGVNLDDPNSDVGKRILKCKLIETLGVCDADVLRQMFRLNYNGIFDKKILEPVIDDIFAQDIPSMNGDELFECMVTAFQHIEPWG